MPRSDAAGNMARVSSWPITVSSLTTEALIRDVRKPNFCLVSVLKTRTEPKPKVKPKILVSVAFSKPNLSHSNSQYLSHSHKALTFFTLRTLLDSK